MKIYEPQEIIERLETELREWEEEFVLCEDRPDSSVGMKSFRARKIRGLKKQIAHWEKKI